LGARVGGARVGGARVGGARVGGARVGGARRRLGLRASYAAHGLHKLRCVLVHSGDLASALAAEIAGQPDRRGSPVAYRSEVEVDAHAVRRVQKMVSPALLIEAGSMKRMRMLSRRPGAQHAGPASCGPHARLY
jgi:hypothetical protein